MQVQAIITLMRIHHIHRVIAIQLIYSQRLSKMDSEIRRENKKTVFPVCLSIKNRDNQYKKTNTSHRTIQRNQSLKQSTLKLHLTNFNPIPIW